MARPTDRRPPERPWPAPAAASPAADPALAGPRSSRRTGRLVWIIAGITAVVAVATVAAVVFLLRDPAGTPSAVRSSAVPASPTPSATPSPSTPAATAGPGNVFYLAGDNPGASKLLFSWRPGGSTRAVAGSSYGYGVVSGSLNFSPDGQRMAYVKPVSADASDSGDLHVANVDGSHDRVLRHSVDAWGVEPAWSPDGTRLVVADWSEPQTVKPGILTVATGAFQALPASYQGAHFHWSGDGTRLVWNAGIGIVSWGPADGSTDPTSVPDTGSNATPPRYIPAIESVSRDGARIVVQVPGPDDTLGDIARDLSANTVLDVASGRAVPLPVTGKIVQMLYRVDGSLLVRVQGSAHDKLVVLRPDLSVATSVDEPATNKSWQILAETP